MALKLVKGSNPKPQPIQKTKSRESYLVECLREELNDPKFTDWEKEFIASVARQVDQGRQLSEKQKGILERIWDK